MKRVAIIQSNYIPWKGYFDVIHMVDEFILYDDMQYTKRDWRNRNMIKTPQGPQWLTIPVDVKGKYFQKINETKISDSTWSKQHWAAMVHNYAKAKYFDLYRERFEQIYKQAADEEYLSRINFRFISSICELLGIRTAISWSMDYSLVEGKTERLIGLCKSAQASHYISGPSAKGYIDETLFQAAGIQLSYVDYAGYPEYPQLFPPFEHGVTILDLLFHVGPDAPYYIWGWREAGCESTAI